MEDSSFRKNFVSIKKITLFNDNYYAKILQHNGATEKKNMMMMSMLKSKKLPKELWAETVACTVYLWNRTSKKGVENTIRSLKWKGDRHVPSFMYHTGNMAN